MVIAIGGLVVACKNEKTVKERNIEKASWLIGSWENQSQYGDLSETWQKKNDSLFLGQTFFIKGKDTLHAESIELREVDGNLIYSPTVKGQNDDKPVAFQMTASSEKQLVFENKAHDYPQKIVYNKITNDSIVAEISGIQQGKPSVENYPMKKK